MSHVHEGDEWKYAKPPMTVESRSISRLRAQEEADRDYALGRITLSEWNSQTDTLSLVAIPPKP